MNPYASLRGLPRGVWVLCVATLVNRLGSMAGPFLALYGTRVLGLSAGEAGLLVGAFGAGMIASAPLGGGLSDRFGARRVFLASLVGGGALMLVFPFLRGLPAAMGGAFLWALVAEAGRPSGMALLGEMTPAGEHRRATAAYRLALNLGMSVGPPLGGALAAWSFTALFVTDAATALAAGLAVFLFLHPVARQSAAGQPAAGQSVAGRAPDAVGASPTRPKTTAAVWRNRRLVGFAVGFAGIWAGFTLQFGPLSVHIVEGLGYATGVYGALVAVNTVLIVLFEVPLLARLRALSAARLVGVGGALVVAGLVLLSGDTLPWLVAGVVVAAFGEMCAMGAAMPLVAALAPDGQRGAAMGVYSLSASVAMALGQSLGTAALGVAPAPAVWLVGAAVALGGTVVSVLAARGVRA